MCCHLQAKEVTGHEPECRIYFAMTKCDLLDHLPSVGAEPLAEASPSGTLHRLSVTALHQAMT